jgi:hypothetical protein
MDADMLRTGMRPCGGCYAGKKTRILRLRVEIEYYSAANGVQDEVFLLSLSSFPFCVKWTIDDLPPS